MTVRGDVLVQVDAIRVGYFFRYVQMHCFGDVVEFHVVVVDASVLTNPVDNECGY